MELPEVRPGDLGAQWHRWYFEMQKWKGWKECEEQLTTMEKAQEATSNLF